MLQLLNVTLRRGPRVLLEGVNLTVHAGQKVGVTGANGSGKSSLFALLRGELHADAGDVSLPPRLVVAHVAQETPASEQAAIDYVLDGDHELREIEAALASAEHDSDGVHLGALHARLDAIDGYAARARAARLLHGLGFSSPQCDAPVRSFSGGWRMRLNLAQALMCRSDLLLLDEPTNHLDLDAVLWLEEWLRAYPGTLLLISHDREFLDAVVDHIAHLEQCGLRLYRGGYSAFEVRRAEDLARQQAAYSKQQREVAHIHSYVERFRAKATKARQAQSRLKALARLELIAPAHVDSPFHFAFRAPEKIPNPLLRLEQVSVGYDAQAVLSGINLSLAPGDRIGLLGRNGAGKSTLVKLLAGELGALSGARETAQDVKLGYFAQHQLEQLDAEASPVQHLRRLDAKASEQELRDYLGGFGFAGDSALRTVGPFSGGEKARLVLALIVYQRPNLLLLDEPTNHLDLEMRHALGLALQEFAGALVVVSHDRHLLRSVSDTLLLVADGRVAEFSGDLEDYRRWLAEQRNGAAAPATASGEHSAAARKERRRTDADRRQRLQPLRRKVERLEQRLTELGEEKARLSEALAESALYAPEAKDRLKTLLLEQRRIEQATAECEADWLKTCEALETAAQYD